MSVITPLQEPAQVPSPSQAARPFLGAPFTGWHLPSEPDSPQASHWPSHLASQQKPSTQKPDEHSTAVVQAAPFSAFAHWPFMHFAPGAQSPSAAQLVVQAMAFASQTKGVQSVVSGVQSPPLPHLAAAARVTASAHLAAAQALPWVETWHALAPSHVAVPRQTPVPSVPQSPSGSVPFATGPQVPSAPEPFFALVQAWQSPSHFWSQQMLSAQKPLLQSSSALQVFGVQREEE
jgi:hypothetical protein